MGNDGSTTEGSTGDDDSPAIDASAAGGGAAGRNGFVESQIRKAYNLANAAVLTPYDGTVRALDGANDQHRSLLSRLTGESPHAINHAVAEGARAQGAQGGRVPAIGHHAHVDVFPQNLEPFSHQRAGSLRYAAGATVAISSFNAMGNDGRMSAEEVRGIATASGISATAARVGDALSARSGNLRGGAIVDSVVTVVTSVSQNNEAVADGTLSAGDATADVVIDTSVGVSAGVVGLTIGAMAGSAVPVIGTAVGAVVGFVAGSLAAWGATVLGNGLLGGVKKTLGNALEAQFEQPLQALWSKIDSAKDSLSMGLSEGLTSLGATVSAVATGIGNTAVNGISRATDAVNGVVQFANSAVKRWFGI